MDDMDRKLESLGVRMGKIKPVTADIGRWRERFIGMRMLIMVILAAFGASLATFGKWAVIKLGWTG